MNVELKKKLEALVGKEFNYEKKNIKITKYRDVGGTNIVIFIDDRPKNLLISEVDGFIEQLFDPIVEELKPTQVTVSKHQLAVFEPTSSNSEIKETLMDTLKKVKEDPNYIPQATAVCNVVQQLVNLQKEEIKMIQILKK